MQILFLISTARNLTFGSPNRLFPKLLDLVSGAPFSKGLQSSSILSLCESICPIYFKNKEIKTLALVT